MDTQSLQKRLLDVLTDNKATDIQILDVRQLTDITDYMFIATALSKRHADALAEKIQAATKAQYHPPLSISGSGNTGWILIDLQDIIVHIMLSETRSFYDLEKLWGITGSTT